MLTDNLQITTMTIDASVKNISFNEKELNDIVIDKLKSIVFNDNKILKISSNFIDPDIISNELEIDMKKKEEEVELNNNIKKRGRKKKDITQFYTQQRKKQGTGKHFNSQITFMIKSFIIPNKISPHYLLLLLVKRSIKFKHSYILFIPFFFYLS